MMTFISIFHLKERSPQNILRSGLQTAKTTTVQYTTTLLLLHLFN